MSGTHILLLAIIITALAIFVARATREKPKPTGIGVKADSLIGNSPKPDAKPEIWFGERFFTQETAEAWAWPVFKISLVAKGKSTNNGWKKAKVFDCRSLEEAQELIKRLDEADRANELSKALSPASTESSDPSGDLQVNPEGAL